MRRVLAFFAIILSSISFAEIRSTRDCTVFAEPNPRSTQVCRIRRGTMFRQVEASSRGLYRVATTSCRGYVPAACVGARVPGSDGESVSPGGEAVAVPASSSASMRLLLDLQLDMLSGGVPYSSDRSSGIGYGAVIGFEPFRTDFLRARFGLGYESLGLKQTIDGTEVVEDSTPAEFSQRMGFLVGNALLGFSLSGGRVRDVEWWIEVGGEYAHPLSATQTTPSSTISFEAEDKLFSALAGLRGDFAVGDRIGLDASVRFFYNLGAAEGSSLMGVRIGGAIALLL